MFTNLFQVVKDRRGIVRVKKLHDHPYYASPKPIDRLITDLETSARLSFRHAHIYVDKYLILKLPFYIDSNKLYLQDL